MKKIIFFALMGFSLSVFLSASVWEGAATLGPDLPEHGRYLATNSYPVNTVVDVTNLENGKSTSLIVYSKLDTSGFLALLSQDAAGALGIENGSLGRIRMEENTDPLVISRLRAEYDFTLVPDRPRPPERTDDGDPAALASLAVPANPVPAGRAVSSFGFSAPLISAFEKGKCYIQIAAYSIAQSVENEINSIDRNLPIAIMNVGTEEKPIYRVLIGPVSVGESGAILDRYNGKYKDAFVWQGR